MNWSFHQEALREYQAAAIYYATRGESLGIRFVHAVEEAIGWIRDRPAAWPVLGAIVRRCLTRGFPYSVLYRWTDDTILIIAVMHASRDPDYWRSRIID